MVTEPVLVALPGTMCSPAVFGPLAAELAGQVTVDPFSWLTTPGPWDIPSVAARVARHVGDRYARPVLVCGHSTGGAIALELAASHPAAVAGLVLADTGAHMRGHDDVDAILARVSAGLDEDLLGAVLDRSFREPLSPGDRAAFLAWAAPLDQRAVYDVLASQRDLDLTARLAGVMQPAVVLHGRFDRARHPDQGRELAAALADGEFRLLETGHTPVYEDPASVAAAVRDVLSRVGSTAR